MSSFGLYDARHTRPAAAALLIESSRTWTPWGGVRFTTMPYWWLESLTTESIANGAVPLGASTYRVVLSGLKKPRTSTSQFRQT